MKRQVILVLGMHRSGTSAVAGILNQLGVSLGSKLMEANEFNEKGYFENSYLVDINEGIINALGSSWDDIFFRGDDTWWKQSFLNEYRNNIIDVIDREFGSTALFCIKDPRICILLPFWISIFQELNIEPLFIITVRHPMEVAESLRRRDGFSIQKGILLWMNYMLCAEYYSRTFQRTFVHFNDFLNIPKDTVRHISKVLNIDFPKTWSEVKSDAVEFLDPGKKHHTYKKDRHISRLTLIDPYLQLLTNLTRSEEVGKNVLYDIDRIRTDYYHFHAFFYNQDVKNLLTLQKVVELVLCSKDMPTKEWMDCIQTEDTLISNFKTFLGNQHTLILNLNVALNSRIAHIWNLETLIKDKDTHIGNLESLMKDKDAHIWNLESLMKDKDAHIINLETAIDEKGRLIEEQAELMQAKDVRIQNIESELDMIKHSRVWRVAESLRSLIYIKILGFFPLLQQSASTISRAGFPVFYQKAKRRVKNYLWRFNHEPKISDSSLSEEVPLKNMDAKIYVRLSDFQMKADGEVIRKKLGAIIDEIDQKRGI